jgi:hypothetical protein
MLMILENWLSIEEVGEMTLGISFCDSLQEFFNFLKLFALTEFQFPISSSKIALLNVPGVSGFDCVMSLRSFWTLELKALEPPHGWRNYITASSFIKHFSRSVRFVGSPGHLRSSEISSLEVIYTGSSCPSD